MVDFDMLNARRLGVGNISFMLTAILVMASSSLIVVPHNILIWSFGLGACLIVIAYVDMRRFIIPDAMNVFLAVLGIAFIIIASEGAAQDHVMGAVLGYTLLYLIHFAYLHYRGRVGLGFGDVKFVAVIGLWLTWEALPSVILYACISGLSCTLVAMIFINEIREDNPIPFGSHLALGTWIVWLTGPIKL